MDGSECQEPKWAIPAHPSLLQELHHPQCFLYIWDLFVQRFSALGEIKLHVTIFPVTRSQGETYCSAVKDARNCFLELLEGALDLSVRSPNVLHDIGLGDNPDEREWKWMLRAVHVRRKVPGVSPSGLSPLSVQPFYGSVGLRNQMTQG